MLAVAALGAACSGGEGGQAKSSEGGGEAACIPGVQAACPCPTPGQWGVHVCKADGSGWDACLGCGSVGAGGSAAGSSGFGGSGVGGAGVGGSGGVGGDPGVGGTGAGGTGGVSGTGGSVGGSGGSVGGSGGFGGGSGGSGGSTGGAGGSGGSTGGFGGVGGGPPPPPPPDGTFAAEINVSKIAIYQGVEVTLMDNGSPVGNRNAPVVIGREALVRVWVTPTPAWQSREVIARLDLQSTDPAVMSQGSNPKTITSASTGSDLGSTFNFHLAPDQVTQDLSFSVSIRETPANEGGSFGTVSSDVLWPTDGSTSPLGGDFSGAMRITIVPFRYNGDGSGRLPDTSQAQMQRYYDAVYAMYPATEIDLQLRDVVDYNNYVGSNSGWSTWLDTLCNLRDQDNVDSQVYYYGIMAPKSSWGSYGGGIAGLGNVPNANGTWGRCSVGLGFNGADTDGLIFAHEVGHTLGRPHAPCGTSGGYFPHSGARIGVRGYDLVDGKLKDPSNYRDVMSYCDPQWISDYNFGKLFDRIQWVNANYYVVPTPPTTYRKVLIDVDGTVSWGGSVTLRVPPGGDTREVTTYGASGNPSGTVTGYWFPFSEDPAGAILVPEPPTDVTAIRPVGLHTMVLP